MTKRMVSKFPGTCTACRQAFPAGMNIVWTAGEGARHATTEACAAAIAETTSKAIAAQFPTDVPGNDPLKPLPPAPTIPLASLIAFIQRAQENGLRFPKVRFLGPDGRSELRIALEGPRGRFPGALQVTLGGLWMGRIAPDGQTFGRLRNATDVLRELEAVERDPVAAAKRYGALMNRCTFCGLPLTDTGSVEVGYGPICAANYNLPWIGFGVPEVRTVPAAPTIVHHPKCTPNYPEKVEGEAPQATTDVEISKTEIARTCNDCGEFVLLKKETE